ncbi:MAG: hypothetical protein WCO58_00670 [bacterium]
MLHIAFVMLVGFLFTQMVLLPPKAYKKTLCDFAEIEEERMVSRFCFADKPNKELDDLSDQLLDSINSPIIFFAKKMSQWSIDCLVVLLLYLFVLWEIELVTVVGVRIIFSSILALCSFIFSAHLIRIDVYKKEAQKDIEQLFLNKKKEEQKALQDLLERTSSDYDATETD